MGMSRLKTKVATGVTLPFFHISFRLYSYSITAVHGKFICCFTVIVFVTLTVMPTQFSIDVNAESPLAALFVRISSILSFRYLACTISAN